MNAEFMRKVQRSGDAVWALPEGTSTTLRVGPGARVIQVCQGRLWLTSPGNEREASIDVWLVPGDSLELPAGLSVVMEAWPSASFRLLVPPCRETAPRSSVVSRMVARAWGLVDRGSRVDPQWALRLAR
jgi:hypothetical protein